MYQAFEGGSFQLQALEGPNVLQEFLDHRQNILVNYFLILRNKNKFSYLFYWVKIALQSTNAGFKVASKNLEDPKTISPPHMV